MEKLDTRTAGPVVMVVLFLMGGASHRRLKE
jgi:hypothetical protein